jgi:hypothetical protein
MNLKETAKEIREILEQKRKELNLSFFEDTHTYTMDDINGETKDDWYSVSKVIKKFYEEFDSDGIAEKKAKGDPIIKAQLLKEWADAGTYSTNVGSRTHYFLEKKSIELFELNKEVRQPVFECDFVQVLKSDSMITAGINFLNLMKERGGELLDTELVLGNPELLYVGQPDQMWLFLDKTGKEIGFVISDFKTNKIKNFEVNNFTKPMYVPFQKHPNNALGHYYLQLPFYVKLFIKMLEGSKYENIKFLGGIIVLLKDDGKFEEFRVPKDVTTTIMNMDMKKYLTT